MQDRVDIRCPNGHRLKVRERRLGEVIACPACGAEFPAALFEQGNRTDRVRPGKPAAPKVRAAEAFSGWPSSAAQEAAKVQPRRMRLSLWERLLLAAAVAGTSATARQRALAKRLAAGLGAVALASAAPPLVAICFGSAGPWAGPSLLLAAVLLVYACWLGITPDFSALWTAMFAAGGFASIYAGAMGVTIFIAPTATGFWGLASLKRQGGLLPIWWCGAIVAAAAALAYLCGRASHDWAKTLRGHG